MAPCVEVEVEQPVFRRGACIVDQDIDAAERATRLVDQRGYSARLGNVARHRDRFAVRGCRDFACRLLEPGFVPCDQGDIAALARQFLRDRAADPEARAGDERTFPLDQQVHITLPSNWRLSPPCSICRARCARRPRIPVGCCRPP